MPATITYCRYGRNDINLSGTYEEYWKDDILTNIELSGKDVPNAALMRISGCTKDKSTSN